MTATKLKSVLASVMLVVVVVGVGTGAVQDKNQVAQKVTLEALAKEPEKFKGKLVQVEGVVEQWCPAGVGPRLRRSPNGGLVAQGQVGLYIVQKTPGPNPP